MKYVYHTMNLRNTSSSGGIGRRVGLKIQSGAISVPVQVWPGANFKKTHFGGSFLLNILLSANESG